MPITTVEQVSLSNTFDDFRLKFNTAANVINDVIGGSATINFDAVVANNLTSNTLTANRIVVAGIGGQLIDDSGLVYDPSSNSLSVNGSLTSTNVNATGNVIISGSGKTFNVGSGANTTTIYTSNGNLVTTNRIDAYHVHANWHVGSGGDLETWATAKGDNENTHKVFAVANTNSATDMLIVNQSSGANAYSEFIAIHANGNTTQGWVSFGLNSPNYTEGAYGITKADDAYILYQAPEGTTHEGDLIIGTGLNGTKNRIIFSAEGFDDPANNTQMIIDPGTRVFINIPTQSSNTSTGALVVNGGIGLQGNLNIGGNVAIAGTITLGGGGNTVSTSTLEVDNPMIFFGANNVADLFDLGFVGEYTSTGTRYNGLVRDASDSGKWKLFSGISNKPANTVNFTSASYDTLYLGAIESVSTTPSSSTTTGAITTAGGLGVAGAINAGGAIRTLNTTNAISTTTGSLIANGGLGVAGNTHIGGDLVVSGMATFTGGLRTQEIVEDIVDVTQSANTVTLDYSTGTVFYRTSTNFQANFTVNITNAPTTDGRVFGITLFQTQGATGYRPSALNINGSPATIKWQAAAAPTPTSSLNKVDVFAFLIIIRNATYEVLASATLNFG